MQNGHGSMALMTTPTIIQFQKWVFQVDVEATREAYAKWQRPSPEECGCLHCRNFAAARPKIYTPDIVAFLSQFGIGPIREAEIWENAEIRPGVCQYGGFFHVVGKVQEGPDWVVEGMRKNADVAVLSSATQGQVATDFWVCFTSNAALVRDWFPKPHIFQIEFQALVPWVLDEQYERAKAY